MRLTGEVGWTDEETASLRWATPDEARELIRETTNDAGRERDLTVLEAALALLSSSSPHTD